MICPVCFCRKYDFKKDGNSGYFVECKKCHGTGIVESQTNEEWFVGLSTEEKAKFLVDVDCGFCGYVCSHRNECEKYDKERDEYSCKCVYGDCTAVEMRVAWLKEVHKE